MKKYLRRMLIFGTPIFMVVVFIAIVDPYNFINISHIISDGNKIEVLNRSNASKPRGNVIWKTIAFKRKPIENVMIGDSQGVDFDTSLIRKLTGKVYFNFNIPGGSYKTMFSVFWFTTDYIKLKNVYFQCGFMNYNAYNDYNLITYGMDILKNPFSYFLDFKIFKDSFFNVEYALSKDQHIVESILSHLNKEETDYLSEYRATNFFEKYKYPKSYFIELKKITDYCKSNNINFYFVITPNYIGLEKYIEKFGLTEKRNRFKADLKSLAPTIDMEYLEGFSDDRSKYYDYFHYRSEYVDQIVKVIWGNNKE